VALRCMPVLTVMTMNNDSGGSQPSATLTEHATRWFCHLGPRSCRADSHMPCPSRSHIQLQSSFYRGSVTSRHCDPLAVGSQDTESKVSAPNLAPRTVHPRSAVSSHGTTSPEIETRVTADTRLKHGGSEAELWCSPQRSKMHKTIVCMGGQGLGCSAKASMYGFITGIEGRPMDNSYAISSW